MKFFRDLAFARFLTRKGCMIGTEKVLRRRSDGTLWVPGHPADFGLCMVGLFTGKAGFHFYKARVWRGVLVASPKIFWQAKSREFDILHEQRCVELTRWPEDIETAKIKALTT